MRGTIAGAPRTFERQSTMSRSEPIRPAVHVPVLLERVTELLAPACSADGAVLVDATLGLAGHSLAMLEAHPGLRLIGLDRDPEARAEAARRIEVAGHSDRVTRVPAVCDELPDVLARLGIAEVQGVLFDLGVSSLQLDRPERGFSYSVDAPLDMWMDPGAPRTAAEIVNTYPPKDLARVLRVYGEERFASRIAAAIDRERAREPFTHTARLAELVRNAIPAATRRTGGHPAKRTFQALRIEVNDELGALERALPAAVEALAVGGRVVVITFHSLEDRIVKQTLAAGAVDRTPPEFPVPVPELGPVLRLLTRGGEEATETEIATNPRAASARVRAAERIRRAA
jgi:16S rRNA (cytosine1402-N4)-methyltransferase